MNTNVTNSIKALTWTQNTPSFNFNKFNACLGAAALLTMAVMHIIPTFVLSSDSAKEEDAVKTHLSHPGQPYAERTDVELSLIHI